MAGYTMEDQGQSYSFDDGLSDVPTEQATQQRVVKTDYALGKDSPGTDALSTAILGGNESHLRDQVAQTEDIKNEAARTSLISQIAQQRGGQLSSDDVGIIQSMSKLELRTDPGTVFEKKMAEKYATDTMAVKGDQSTSVFNRFGYFDPQVATQDVDVYTGVLQSMEYEKAQLENLHGEWSKSSLASSIPQYIGQIVPLLSSWRLHNVLANAPTTSILPGDNLGQQISYLKALPPTERKAAYDAALTQLKGQNMLDAMTFAQAVVSFSATDSFIANAVGVADVQGIASVAGKGLMKIAGKLARAPVASVLSTADKTADLAESILRQSSKPKGPGLVDYTLGAIQEMKNEAGVKQASSKFYYIPEGAARNLEAVTSPTEGSVTGFKTAQGSTYEYNPVVGGSQTVRTRVPHTGDKEGTQTTVEPRSANTYFVDSADMDAVRIPKGAEKRVVEFKDGDIGISVKQPDGQWSIPYGSTKLRTSPLPKVGAEPIEVWGQVKNTSGTPVYSDFHRGNKITEVSRGEAEPVFHTDVKNNVTVPLGQPGEGMVPVEVGADGSVKFHPTQTGEIHHINKETAVAQKPVQKFGRAPEYNASFDKDGNPIFAIDRKNKVYASTVAPGKDTVAVSVSKSGRFQFVATGRDRAGAEAGNDFRTGLKDAAKGVADTTIEPEAIVTGQGDIAKAGQLGAANRITRMVQKAPQSLKDILETVQSSFNPENFFGSGKALSREFKDRIVNKLTTDNEFLTNVLGKLHVPRGTELAVQQGVRETEAKFRTQYGGRLSDAILDFVHVPPELNPNGANLDTLIMRVGKPNGLAFDSRAEAEQYLRDVYELQGHMTNGAGYVAADVKQKGTSFFIHVEKHVDETTDAYQRALRTAENTTPVNLWNMMLNHFRSSEDLLSSIQRDNRNIATHAPQVLNKALKEQLEQTRNTLTGRQRKEVLQILEANRDDVNLANPSQRGTFYTSASDFENAFLNKIGHLPTQEQTAHYFNYVRVSDFDWVIRNLALYRDKGRLGIEQFSFKTLNEKEGSVRSTPFVEGKSLDEIPWGGQDAGIWVQEANGSGRLLYKHDLVNTSGGLTKQDIEKLYKEKGYRVMQVFDPPGRPLDGHLFHPDTSPVKEQVHFIISDGLEQKPLGWNQLDYRPGGHSIYKYDWYVKQPQLIKGVGGRDNYYGDNSVMNFASQAQAEKYAQRMDTARIMLSNNDPQLPAYLAANIPYSLEDFQKMFYKGHLNLEHPIVAVKNGTTAFDNEAIKRAYPTYVDATKSEYNLGALIDKSFQADRDAVLNTVKEGPGVFQIAPASQLDPYTAMNRGLGQAVRNLWMADYKIGAVQHWIEEFGTVMDPKFKTVSNSPLYFLYHPQWNEKADKATLAAAKASRLAIVNFVGAQSEIAGRITHLQNSLVSSIYTKFGQNASEMVADYALPFIKDPASYLRAVAFHTKLGFFNPIQLFVQSQSLAHVLAVAGPGNALPGFSGAMLARRLIHNHDPAILDRFADMAAGMGWQRADFKQMVGALKMSGIPEVAGETAMRDDVMDPKLYSSTVGKWLDKGTMFFAEGERSVRLAAFATAFREWKLANPLAQLGNREMGTIMNRSNLLSVNMTRASAAAWQSGVISIPTQFLAFNARLAEQFLGGRLTVTEKARAFATYSALYGVPTATAGALGVWPFYDDIKEAGLARGVDFSPAYMQALTEGIPHLMISAVTGHEYNIAQRLGPNGSSLFRDAFSGDKSVMQVLGGPSASIVGDIWNSTDPIRRTVAGVFTGNSEAFPIKTQDLTSALQTISTLSLEERVRGALSYGKYISRTGLQVGDMDGIDAAFATLGLTPTHIADAQLLSKIEKGDKNGQKGYETLVLQNWAKAVAAGASGNAAEFADYMKRVQSYITLGDFNEEEKQRLYSRALKYQPDSEQRIRWDMVKNAPNSQYIDRFNSFFVNKEKAK